MEVQDRPSPLRVRLGREGSGALGLHPEGADVGIPGAWPGVAAVGSLGPAPRGGRCRDTRGLARGGREVADLWACPLRSLGPRRSEPRPHGAGWGGGGRGGGRPHGAGWWGGACGGGRGGVAERHRRGERELSKRSWGRRRGWEKEAEARRECEVTEWGAPACPWCLAGPARESSAASPPRVGEGRALRKPPGESSWVSLSACREVFKAKHRKTGKKVALKKVLMENEKEGFPITALREIKILQLLKHENVVNLIEICRTKASPYNRCKGSIYLVFDFCEHDLAGLLSNVLVKFTLSEIKKVMQMLLNGLYYIHRNKILHRDMKAANVLITRDGVLKLADFGLARAFSLAKNSQPNRYTNRVVTLWYRPPELLLGERDYGPPIDLWGAGCIMAEMWTRSPIMQGNTEQHQLALISQLCGSITPEVWPNVDKYELFEKLELVKGQKRKVKDRLKAYVRDPYALDLIDKLLVLDPAQRIDSDDALNHDFFWSDPMPSDLKGMLSTHLTSMFEYLAPPRRKGSQITQQSTNQSRNPATTNQTEFERVF
ncbi:cyclin-dependent kinase 9 [Tupaia chinensis]|uniref:cyclin-dependent kinase 9 n=1 Tax=Tupaia chinensis TaxID=246437 RepID=UPI000FFB1235|nr:cyclin-dependent kinase 9 [Tupaia chinensis]